MRVGIAHVEVRANTEQYKADLRRMESMTLGSANRVNASLSKLGGSYQKMGTQAGSASKGVDKMTESTKKQGKSLLTLIPHVAQVTIAYMAMRVAWRSVMTAVLAGVEFEKKMAVVAAVSRATREEFELLNEAARTQAKTTTFTATQTADALKYLAMAGFSVKEQISSLPGVLELALIGELELGRATDIATDTLRAFGLEASSMSRVNDVFVSTITRTNTNIEMLGQSMKFAAPVARALGYEIEQVSAMLGVLATAGVKAGIAGRNLQQAFVRTQKAAERMGLGTGAKLMDVIKAYAKEQDRLAEKLDKTAALERMAGIIRKDYGLIALKSILILKDNIKAYEMLEKAVYLSAGESKRAFLIMENTVDASWKRLKSIITDISIGIFKEYELTIKEALANITRWFSENQSVIERIATDIFDVANSVWELFKAADSLAGSIPGIEMFYKAISPKGKSNMIIQGLKDIGIALEAVRLEREGFMKMPKGPTGGVVFDLKEQEKYMAIVRERVEAGKLLEATVNKYKDTLKTTRDAIAAEKKAMAEGNVELVRAVKFLGMTPEIYTGSGMDKIIAQQMAQTIEELPKVERAIYDSVIALETFKEGIADTFGDLSDYGPKQQAAIKAVSDYMVKEYNKDIKEKENALKKVDKDITKYALSAIKTEKGKFAEMREMLKQWEEWAIAAGADVSKVAEGVAIKEKQIMAEETAFFISEAEKQVKADKAKHSEFLKNADKNQAIIKQLYEMGTISASDYMNRAKAINEKVLDAQEEVWRKLGYSEGELYALRIKAKTDFENELISLTQQSANQQVSIIAQAAASAPSIGSGGSGRPAGTPNNLSFNNPGGVTGMSGMSFYEYRGQTYYSLAAVEAAVASYESSTNTATVAANTLSSSMSSVNTSIQALASSLTGLQDRLDDMIRDRERKDWGLPEYLGEWDRLDTGLANTTDTQEQVDILTDMLDTLQIIIRLEEESLAASKALAEDMKDQSTSIQEWLFSLGMSNLAPVQAAGMMGLEYERLYADALAGENIDVFLAFAKEYLEYFADFTTDINDYALEYDKVVGDVQALGDLTDLWGALADLGLGTSIEEINLLIDAFAAMGVSAGALGTAVGLGDQGFADLIMTLISSGGLVDATGETSEEAFGLGTMLAATNTPFSNVQDAINAMADTTGVQLTSVAAMFDALAVGIGQAATSIAGGIQDIYDIAQANPIQNITYEPVVIEVPFQQVGTYKDQYTEYVAQAPSGSGMQDVYGYGYYPPAAHAFIIWGPTGRTGGLFGSPTIGGEAGPEWFVPTYEPERSNFLRDVGADPETIGTTIAKKLAPLMSSSDGQTFVLVVDGEVIGNIVAKETGTNPALRNAIQRIS